MTNSLVFHAGNRILLLYQPNSLCRIRKEGLNTNSQQELTQTWILHHLAKMMLRDVKHYSGYSFLLLSVQQEKKQKTAFESYQLLLSHLLMTSCNLSSMLCIHTNKHARPPSPLLAWFSVTKCWHALHNFLGDVFQNGCYDVGIHKTSLCVFTVHVWDYITSPSGCPRLSFKKKKKKLKRGLGNGESVLLLLDRISSPLV